MFPERCFSSLQMVTARIIQQKGVASAEEEAVVGVRVGGGEIYIYCWSSQWNVKHL